MEQTAIGQTISWERSGRSAPDAANREISKTAQFLRRASYAVGELTSSQQDAIKRHAGLEAGEIWLDIRLDNIERLDYTIRAYPRPFLAIPALHKKIGTAKIALEYAKQDFKDKLDGKEDPSAHDKITEELECRFDKREGRYVFGKTIGGLRMPYTDIRHPAGHFEKGTSNFCYYYVPWYDKH